MNQTDIQQRKDYLAKSKSQLSKESIKAYQKELEILNYVLYCKTLI